MMKELKILAITSLPTVGNAGLKKILNIVGGQTIPIPTLIACGLGNMTGHKKIDLDFNEILHDSLQMAKNYNYELIAYVGYLKNEQQIDAICDVLKTYEDIIKAIVIDPICGDNQKAYIADSIVQNFYKLLTLAHYVLPNETELRILTGNDFDSDIESVIEDFRKAYPNLDLLVTSVKKDGKYYNYLNTANQTYRLAYDKIGVDYSGTGDVFAALFIKNLFFKQHNHLEALELTTEYLQRIVAYSHYQKKPVYDVSLLSNWSSVHKKGSLFYVIGPSGVGKDTLMNIAQKHLQESNVVFAKRYITRSKQSDGEDHIPINKDDFVERIEDGYFGLWWQSHGNYYGIGVQIDQLLNSGFNVVVNGSRGYFHEANKRYPEMKTILITAKPEIIKERLLKRGRETPEEVEKRLERSKSFENMFESLDVIKLSNDGALETTSKSFIAILEGNYSK